MTLDEIHAKLEEKQREMTRNRDSYSESEIELNGELILMVEELNDIKHELNFADYALDLACEHIVKENPFLFSLVGRGLKRVVKEEFIRIAKKELEVKRLTEDKE